METASCIHGAAPNIKNKSTNKEEILQFWSLFRNLCHDFNQQIDALLLLSDGESHVESASKAWSDEMKNKVRCHYATASKRNEGRLELDSVLKGVRLLQQHVLSSSSSMATVRDISSTTNKNFALNKILSQSVPDLPLTDIRLLSAEMEKILNRIDEAREIICPKEKFVFKRYRKSLEELNLNTSGDEAGVSVLSENCKLDDGKQMQQKEEKPHEEQQAQEYGGAIENKSNCIIDLLHDGSVKINNQADSHKQWQVYTVPRPYASLDLASDAICPSSYLLQNLTDATVILHPTLQSLHIQNVHNCKIYSSVHGPVHVTNCQKSEIRCSAYQLRVHDSKNVEFGVWARSGPIIEDCTTIVFAGDFYTSLESDGQPGRNMYWDVKDFNWLKCLRKSPNFTVVEMNSESGSGGNEGKVGPDDASYKGQEEIHAPVTAEEDDSEDEL